MTLSQIAEQACEDVGYPNDTTLLPFAKRKCANRYQIIWNDQLWKDSLYQFEQRVTPDAAASSGEIYYTDKLRLEATGQILLPELVERIIAIRTTERPLYPMTMETLWRTNPDVFEQTGTPCGFSELGQVAMAFAPEQTRKLFAYFYPASEANETKVFVRGICNRVSNSSAANPILNDVKPLNLMVETEVVVTGDETEIVNGAFSCFWTEIQVIKKPTTENKLILIAKDQDGNVTTSLDSIPAAKTSAPTYRRIQLVKPPLSNTVLRCLVKKKLAPLTNDNDSPELTGADAVLLPLVTGDLHWLMKEGDLANAKWSEGGALLEQMKRASVYQTANQPRITPSVEPDWRDIHRSGVPSKGYYIG